MRPASGRSRGSRPAPAAGRLGLVRRRVARARSRPPRGSPPGRRPRAVHREAHGPQPSLRRGREPRRGLGRRRRPECPSAPQSRAAEALEPAALLRRSLDDLDGELSVAGPFQRLQAVVAHICGAVDAARAVDLVRGRGERARSRPTGRSTSGPDGPGRRAPGPGQTSTRRRITRRRRGSSGPGAASSSRADDPDGDPGEIELLRSFRMSAVLAAAAPGRRGQLARRDLRRRAGGSARAGRAVVRLLVAEAVRRRAGRSCRVRPARRRLSRTAGGPAGRGKH